MRVTHQAMYSTFTNQINTNLSSYLDLNFQASTMKQINAPSDDPSGAAHVLNYRVSIDKTSQLEDNVDTALGWLKLEDGILTQVDTTVIRLKELAEQAATGTVSDENRLQISAEINQLLEELVSLANSEFNGSFAFAGQNIDKPPYELGIGTSSIDPNLEGLHFETSGEIDGSYMVRIDADGQIPPIADIPFSYSNDAGQTWQTGVIPAGATSIQFESVEIELPVVPAPGVQLTGYNPDEPLSENNGTNFIVRPAAIYTGYDDDVPPEVTIYGEALPADVEAHPNGFFDQNVQVRLDDDVDLTIVPQTITYSYSTDQGQTWITQSVDSYNPNDAPIDGRLRLPIPGGFFDLTAPTTSADAEVPAGTQFSIKPQRTAIDYESSQDTYVKVNSVGKDIFGGLYTPQGTDVEVSAFGGSGFNLFETVGNFIGALETNNQEGCARALEDFDHAMEQLLISQADIGGRMNRLESTQISLENSKLDQTERLSQIEDVDVTELTMQLSMQQMAYQTVLQSSSMIMKLNLTNFI